MVLYYEWTFLVLKRSSQLLGGGGGGGSFAILDLEGAIAFFAL